MFLGQLSQFLMILLFDNLPKPFFELYYLGINVSTTPAIFSLFHLMGNTYRISNLFLFNDLREKRSMPLINDNQVLHVLKILTTQHLKIARLYHYKNLSK